jgi:hypothetical protein
MRLLSHRGTAMRRGNMAYQKINGESKENIM